MAAGIAHAVEKGELPKSKLRGASKQMYASMKSSDLDKFASTKHKGLPQKKEESAQIHAAAQEIVDRLLEEKPD
jgi:hypothetical protein